MLIVLAGFPPPLSLIITADAEKLLKGDIVLELEEAVVQSENGFN